MITKDHTLLFTRMLSMTLLFLQTHTGDAQSDLADACCPHETSSPQAPSSANPPKNDLLKRMCEHKILTYTCDECRYETGVVKLAPALLTAGTNSPALVQLGTATRQKVEQGIEVGGEIGLNDNATIHISPPVSGILRNVKGDTGMLVKPGDILAELESAELEQAINAYVKSRIQTDTALRNYQREKALAEQKVSAQVEADEALARYENYKADRDEATHALKAMGFSEPELASLSGDSPCTLPLRAPCDGTLIEKQAVAGNRIQAGQTAMTISDLSSVWVWLDLYERDLAPVLEEATKQKLTVTLETRAFPGRHFKGTLESLGTTMNETTRTVKARALIPNPDGLLRPGMFCKASLTWTRNEDVLTVPRVAVLEDEGQGFVFTHLKDDYYLRTPIKKGREFSESIEILEGLKAGETVVTEGAFLLKSDVLREKMGAGCAD